MYQPFTLATVGFSFYIARLSILTDIRAHGYMGPFDYLFAVIKQGCILLFFLFMVFYLADKEKKYLGTTCIADLFVHGNDKLATEERIKFIKSIYNETVTVISYWLYGH